MYTQDSFFTLSGWGQVGLAGVSTLLALLVLTLVFWAAKGRRWWLRLAIAVLVFWGFAWLSPQVYYAYYRVIFDDLPQQWVIGWPIWGEAARYLTFTGPANLSAHGQGALGWLLILLAIFRR